MPLRYVSHKIAFALCTVAAAFLAALLFSQPTLRHGWPLATLITTTGVGGLTLWFWLRQLLTLQLEVLGRTAEQHLLGNRDARFPEEGAIELAHIGRLLNSVVAELLDRNAELRRSEAKYRVIFEYSRDALTAIAPPDWRFVSVNRAAMKLFGIEDDATLLSMTPGDVSPAQQADGTPSSEAARTHIQATLRDGTADFDWTHVNSEGRLIPCRVLLARLELEGQVMVQGTVRDMTEVRAAEERNLTLQTQVLEAQKLEAVGRLAGGVAHDFNNMLAVISLQAELALELLDAGKPPREQLMQICEVTDRSASIVRQLLDFSRRQTTAARPLNLDATISGSLDLLRTGLGVGMQIEWQPGAGNWLVKLDPVQVDQILTNLCSNARDACKGLGRIRISTRNTQLDSAACANLRGLQPGSYVVLCIEDDGPGLSDEALAHVFEPFFTTKEVGKGTGLGLASVYGLVRQAQGDVHVNNRPDQGVCFTLYFPSHEGQTAAVRPTGASVHPVQIEAYQGSILLVEDQPELLRLFSESLQRVGYSVCAVSNPAAALAAASQPSARFDLLLSDVVMPGMNGLRLAQELRSIHPGMQELFMSGYSDLAMEEQGLDTQGVKILAKPFSLPHLLQAVRTAMNARPG